MEEQIVFGDHMITANLPETIRSASPGIMTTYPLKRLQHAARVFVAGAQTPALIEHLGFEPTVSVEEALARAQSIHGKDASIVFVRYPQFACRK